MKHQRHTGLTLAALAAMACWSTAQAALPSVKITEWEYKGSTLGTVSDSEFIEFTNLGSTAVDFTGWSFDDNTRQPGSQSLSAFGVVQAGESVVLTAAKASDFKTAWNLGASVKVIGLNTNNLGSADEINLYDAGNNLIDRLTYDNAGTGTVKGPITSLVSAEPSSMAALGANNASLWVLSSVGDAQGSYKSTTGDIGSPGKFTVPVPEPETYALLLMGLGCVSGFVGLRTKRG